jgi:hypothetical protein
LTATATTPTAAALQLRDLAGRLAAVYRAETGADAILLTGSAATGVSDFYSDLDLIVYYRVLPPESAIAAARASVGARDAGLLAPPSEEAYGETFTVGGVPCQVVHETVAAWEQELHAVLVDHDVDSPLQKAVAGLHEGIPLHGAELIAGWRAHAVYPDGLARAMVERYWRFFPLWHVQGRLATRDAALWRQQVLVESALNLLGTLAGLNRVWFTTFQPKHLRAFVDQLEAAPPNLADRLESLFAASPGDAISELETLVAEVQALLRTHMPDVDADLARGPGTRECAWRLAEVHPSG